MNHNAHSIVNNYVEALRARTNQLDDEDYTFRFLYSTLMDLKLKEGELDRLMADTETLNELIDKQNNALQTAIKNQETITTKHFNDCLVYPIATLENAKVYNDAIDNTNLRDFGVVVMQCFEDKDIVLVIPPTVDLDEAFHEILDERDRLMPNMPNARKQSTIGIPGPKGWSDRTWTVVQ
jgi:hypothetical protein